MGCDFGLIGLDGKYSLLNYNKLYSSYLLSELQINTNEVVTQHGSIIKLITMGVDIYHALRKPKYGCK